MGKKVNLVICTVSTRTECLIHRLPLAQSLAAEWYPVNVSSTLKCQLGC